MKKSVLCALVISAFIIIPAAFAGRVDLTTYYPAPYGEYKNLKSTESSYFATSSGSVGIGTTSPGFKLAVAQDMTMGGDVTNGTAQMVIQGTATAGKKLLLGYDTNGNGFGFIKAGNEGVVWTNLALQPNGGSVGIGTTAPTQMFSVAEKFWVTSAGYPRMYSGDNFHIDSHSTRSIYLNYYAGTGVWLPDGWHNPSDIRLKKDIITIQNALDKVLALRGVNFKWKNSKPDASLHMGMIAQEVEKVVPEVIYTTDNKMKTKAVEYQYIVALLVEAIKEQQKEIVNLKSESQMQNELLKKEIAELKKQ